jgi:DNA-directed RNA polymerase subunit N (RpoN/RPB10)
MAQFIRCPSCSFCFAPYMEFFDKAKQAKYAEEVFGDKSDFKDYDPDKLALNPGSSAPLQEIFDALKITNRCCRMRMMSKMEFDKLYK